MFDNFTPAMLDLFVSSLWETLIMVGISGIVGGLIGVPLGVFLRLTDHGGVLENGPLNKLVGWLVNAVRSTPFIILLVAIIPFTRFITGSSIGTAAAVVPLTIAAAPFVARLVESALREVDQGLIEAAQAMGATTGQIVWKVLLPEALPGIVAGLTISFVSLTDARIARVAIANPKHAPYGKRAEEALRAAGLWDKVEPKLVYGENIAHTAQFVQTGNAQVGVIALALALNPELASKGGYWLIPDHLHAPLEQGFVITKRAESNALAQQFADYMGSKAARAVMTKYGFVLPGEAAGK